MFPVGTIFSGASSVSTSAVKLLGFFLIHPSTLRLDPFFVGKEDVSSIAYP